MTKLDNTIPVTILRDVLKKVDPNIADSTAALAYFKELGEDSELLKEKACAAIALDRSLIGLWDPHGFNNTMLILNGRPASVDMIPAVDPILMNYGVWELNQAYPEVAVGPETMRAIVTNLQTFDYVYPPEELGCVEDKFLDLYGSHASSVKKKYYELRAPEVPVEEADSLLEEAFKGLKDTTEFVQFHVLRLLACDSYLRKMQEVYYEWKSLLED